MIAKHLGPCLALLLIAASPASSASTDLHRDFATCAGRLAAQAEYEAATSAPQLSATQALLGQFRDLTEATAQRADWRDSIDIRVRAKLAHQAILTRADTSENTQDARWARQRAAREIARCRSLLLGG
ncbi:hypothetical protein [Aestuariivita boseongensis]|uniref:hypothetical protein n=1 Tax=Aestuariivita boseongensis TaxID=1470562 RepID=UPI000680C2FF|nr:hypothetical protein [Aestuariivita boseongensis]